jgi:hypothetical protein
MAEYITKKKREISDPQRRARKEEGIKRDPSGFIVLTDENFKKMTGAPEFGKDIVIIAPDRLNKRSGGKVCKLATKGKGRAYGKNS